MLRVICPPEEDRAAGLLLLRLSELRVGVDAEPGQDVGQGDGGAAVGAAEAVLPLAVDVEPGAVHLGAAPLGALVAAPVDPLGTGDVGHAVEGEGKHTGTPCVRP